MQAYWILEDWNWDKITVVWFNGARIKVYIQNDQEWWNYARSWDVLKYKFIPLILVIVLLRSRVFLLRRRKGWMVKYTLYTFVHITARTRRKLARSCKLGYFVQPPVHFSYLLSANEYSARRYLQQSQSRRRHMLRKHRGRYSRKIANSFLEQEQIRPGSRARKNFLLS